MRMSESFRPIPRKFIITVVMCPTTPWTSSRISIGSRNAGAMLIHLMEFWSILLRSANRGKSWRLASPIGAAGALGLEGEGRLVVPRHYSNQLVIGILTVEANHRIKIGKPNVVGAACHF